jgi:hypothetical protein
MCSSLSALGFRRRANPAPVRNWGLAQPGATVLPIYAQVLFPPILARFEIVSGADPRAREGYGVGVCIAR